MRTWPKGARWERHSLISAVVGLFDLTGTNQGSKTLPSQETSVLTACAGLISLSRDIFLFRVQ